MKPKGQLLRVFPPLITFSVYQHYLSGHYRILYPAFVTELPWPLPRSLFSSAEGNSCPSSLWRCLAVGGVSGSPSATRSTSCTVRGAARIRGYISYYKNVRICELRKERRRLWSTGCVIKISSSRTMWSLQRETSRLIVWTHRDLPQLCPLCQITFNWPVLFYPGFMLPVWGSVDSAMFNLNV